MNNQFQALFNHFIATLESQNVDWKNQSSGDYRPFLNGLLALYGYRVESWWDGYGLWHGNRAVAFEDTPNAEYKIYAKAVKLVLKKESDLMKGLIEGRNVHFVLIDNPKGGSDHRAGFINEVLDPDQGVAGITIFLQEGDYSPHLYHTRQVIGTYSDTMEPGTWHWIEQA